MTLTDLAIVALTFAGFGIGAMGFVSAGVALTLALSDWLRAGRS